MGKSTAPPTLRKAGEDDPVLIDPFPLDLVAHEAVDPLRGEFHSEPVFPRRHRRGRVEWQSEDVEPVTGYLSARLE